MSYSLLRKVASPVLLLSVCAYASAASAQGGTPANKTALANSEDHGAPNPQNPKIATPLLPSSFAGQPREGDIVTMSTPAQVDAAHAGVLKEDGFVTAAAARYQGIGLTSWTVQVIRFGDLTGALSAFTAYRDPAMQAPAVGDNAAANPALFLVRNGTTLTVVRAPELGGGDGKQDARQLLSSVKALIAGLPPIGGPAAIPPVLPGLLPAEGLEKQTMRYAIGPQGYSGPLPVAAIDFKRDGEAAVAQYRLRGGGTAILTLIMLPTPQIAGAALRTTTALPDATLHVAARRSGPLVGVVSGAGVSQQDAEGLLSKVHYVSDLTLNQPQGYISEVAKTAKLLLGIAYLIAILGIAAFTIAIFLGGGRLLLRRLRGKPDSVMNDDDFISLKL